MQYVLPLLLVAFIILKVANVITWSWWLVLWPLWVSLGGGLIVLIGMFVTAWFVSR